MGRGAADCLVVCSQGVSFGLKSPATTRVAVRDGLARISAPWCPLIVSFRLHWFTCNQDAAQGRFNPCCRGLGEACKHPCLPLTF